MPDPTVRRPSNRRDRALAARLRYAIGAATDGWIPRVFFVGVGVVYLLLYLVGFGDLWITAGPGEFTVRGAANPLRAFTIGGLGRFGAVAVVYLGGLGLTYLFSPLNLLAGVVVATLAGANAALTYRGIRARSISAVTVIAAGVPPVLLAIGCLGPTIVLLAQFEVSSAALVVVRLLVPISTGLLVASLLRIIPQVHA